MDKDKEKFLENFKKNWFTTMATAMTSTEEKTTTSTEERKSNSSTEEKGKGKQVLTPIEASNAHWQTIPHKKEKQQVDVVALKPIITSPTYSQATKKPRPEDSNIIKPWYNKSLQKLNPLIYEAFCHLHTFAQRTQLRPIDFHLSNLEKLLLKEIEKRDQTIFQYEKQLNEQLQGYQKARESANNMISYSKLESSFHWEEQIQKIANPTIKHMLENLQLSDLVKVRVKDFGLFLDAFKSKNHLLQRIKKEEKIHELLELYHHNLVSTDTVIELLNSLSIDPLLEYFDREKVFFLIHHHPCLLVSPQELLNYTEHIQHGIVSELYCLPNEKYPFFPPIIQEHLTQLNSQFHILIKFQIFSIWEEIHQLHQYSSYQLWCASWAIEPPKYELIKKDKIKIDLTIERVFNSYLFHKMIKEEYEKYSYLKFSKNIILYSNLMAAPKEFSQEEIFSQILLATENTIGPFGFEGQEKYLDEELREALVDPISAVKEDSPSPASSPATEKA